jgi:hypothetical protein
MVAVSEIGWGSYRQYSGPFYRGKFGYTLPSSPRPEDLQMAVITATEGGHFDAWNGYDVCGWTSGLIQWCERGQYSVSDMLGEVAKFDRELLFSLNEQLGHELLSFKPNAKGRYRFFFSDGRGEVDSQAEQQALFYAGGDGTQGSWNAVTSLRARAWAAAISTVWENKEAQRIQVEYTAKRLGGFLLPFAKSVFTAMPSTDTARGIYAAYLSFAANNPTWAVKALQTAVTGNLHITPWTSDWAIVILRELTFGPGVAIYPHRYDSIRPVLERLYGMNLPDFSDELKAWTARTGIPAGITTARLQRALISLGYDLGPAKADGKYGKKTTEAVLTLEQLSGMVPRENQDGQVDQYTWPALQEALSRLGLSLLA